MAFITKIVQSCGLVWFDYLQPDYLIIWLLAARLLKFDYLQPDVL